MPGHIVEHLGELFGGISAENSGLLSQLSRALNKLLCPVGKQNSALGKLPRTAANLRETAVQLRNTVRVLADAGVKLLVLRDKLGDIPLESLEMSPSIETASAAAMIFFFIIRPPVCWEQSWI